MRCGYQSEATTDEHVLGVWFRGKITDAKLSSDHFWHLFAIVAKHGPVFSEIWSPWQANTGRWTTWIYLSQKDRCPTIWGVIIDVTSHYFLQDPPQIKTHYSGRYLPYKGARQ